MHFISEIEQAALSSLIILGIHILILRLIGVYCVNHSYDIIFFRVTKELLDNLDSLIINGVIFVELQVF
jgi:hypothetical protein